MLKVLTFEKNTHIPPRMIMESAVIIAPKKMMKIDIEIKIARDYPPAAKIRIYLATNMEVGFSRYLP